LKDKDDEAARNAAADKAEEFLGVLELKVGELLTIAKTPENHPSEIDFDDYQEFRDTMGECLSFLIIIERHLDAVEEPRKTELRDVFDDLTVSVWSILLDGSLRFLNVISVKEHLPLGTRHVFVHELKTLHDAEKTLRKKKYRKRVSKEISDRREKAEKILLMIIDKAPSLLEFRLSS
jgi:hypothetical protein